MFDWSRWLSGFPRHSSRASHDYFTVGGIGNNHDAFAFVYRRLTGLISLPRPVLEAAAAATGDVSGALATIGAHGDQHPLIRGAIGRTLAAMGSGNAVGGEAGGSQVVCQTPIAGL